MKKNIPIVEITKLPAHSYFEWFLLGFYELERQGKIKLQIHVDWVRTIAKFTSSRYINGPLKRTFRYHEYSCCEGVLHYGGKDFRFCIDRLDEPSNYSVALLENCACYFKMQCPLDFPDEGYRITDQMIAPWISVREHKGGEGGEGFGQELLSPDKIVLLRTKVKPLMVGPRMLSWGISYRALKNAYDHYMHDSYDRASYKLMCYFGYAIGLAPRYFEGKPRYKGNKYCTIPSNHISPNEKRKVAFDIMSTLGEGYDARLISDGKPGDPPTRPEMVVPLKEFCKYISNFEYNLNISGNLMSIPNRFIESFMVGTAIVTDKLAVKWYKPFGCEVVETVPMGYLPMDEVDWEQFKKDITNLPSVNKKDILHEFDTKWRPDVVAQYMIDEILAAGEAQQ